MPDLERLNKIIKDSGITITAIALKTGINRTTIYNRLNGIGEWKASEIKNISKALHLSTKERDSIFFN